MEGGLWYVSTVVLRGGKRVKNFGIRNVTQYVFHTFGDEFM